ncbi:Alpha-N-acetylglucosaminidase-like protein [Drosera capensis]
MDSSVENDTFNDKSPRTDDPDYISSLGAAVYKAMAKGDKNAVWLMQGWLFYSNSQFWKPPQTKALLHSVPYGKMIVLDLFVDVKPIWKTSSQFYGTPCLVGVGMCMEGIEQSPVVYEQMAEMAFRSEKIQRVAINFSFNGRRHYGKAVEQVEAAWEILHRTVYNFTDGIADHNTDLLGSIPGLLSMFQAESTGHKTYQCRIEPGDSYYLRPILPCPRRIFGTLPNASALDHCSDKFLQLIRDIDELLAADDNFLLGTRLQSAEQLASDTNETKQYEWNARTQVTNKPEQKQTRARTMVNSLLYRASLIRFLHLCTSLFQLIHRLFLVTCIANKWRCPFY